MCECGCSMGSPTYRLPINARACFLIELYRGCRNCPAPPGVVVRRIDHKSASWHDIKDAPLFPLAKVHDYQEAFIKCGTSPDEFRKDAAAQIVESTKRVDADLAEVIADDLWDEVVRQIPEVISYEGEST